MGGCLDRNKEEKPRIQEDQRSYRSEGRGNKRLEKSSLSRAAIENEFDVISHSDAYSINDDNIAASICANYKLLNRVSTIQKIEKTKVTVEKHEQDIRDAKEELEYKNTLRVTKSTF